MRDVSFLPEAGRGGVSLGQEWEGGAGSAWLGVVAVAHAVPGTVLARNRAHKVPALMGVCVLHHSVTPDPL